jgi:hypothetical protein
LVAIAATTSCGAVSVSSGSVSSMSDGDRLAVAFYDLFAVGIRA